MWVSRDVEAEASDTQPSEAIAILKPSQTTERLATLFNTAKQEMLSMVYISVRRINRYSCIKYMASHSFYYIKLSRLKSNSSSEDADKTTDGVAGSCDQC